MYNEEIKQNAFQPITKAIGSVDSITKGLLDQNQNVMDSVPVVDKFGNICIPESSYYEEEYQFPSSTPIRTITDISKRALSSPQEEEIQNSTLMETVVSPDTVNKIIGPIAQKYLPIAKDDKFGLYWN